MPRLPTHDALYLDRVLQHRARRDRRQTALIRFLVILINTLMYMALPGARDNVPWPLALAIGVASVVYAAWGVIHQPESRFPWVRRGYANPLLDALFLTMWIAVTGGAASPFYVSWYVGVIGAAYRFHARGIAFIATVYSSAYLIMAIVMGQWAAYGADVLFRIAFIYVAAMTAGLLAHESIRVQIELMRARDVAEAASQAKSSFLANMSHEIRTPLSAMLGFTELLVSQNEPVSPATRRHLETVLRNGRLLAALIDDILDLSKVEAGRLTVDTQQSVPLAPLLSEVVELFTPEAQRRGISLFLAGDIGGPTMPRRIATDGLRLRQILLNLVGNAVKFTGKGTVTVSVLARDGQLVISVRDTGCGLAPEQRSTLFQPFSQGDSSISRRFGGTGLGLALSKHLARALGGDLELSWSEPGVGSCFTLRIPLALPAGLAPELPPRTVAAEPPKLSEFREALRGLCVLLADDAPDNRALVARVLQTAGAKVDVAADGAEAIERALHGDYDLLLMDLQMPRVDGYEAARRLRQAGFTRPIVALSAHALDTDRERSFLAGCTDHVAKPVDFAQLIDTVARLARPAGDVTVAHVPPRFTAEPRPGPVV